MKPLFFWHGSTDDGEIYIVPKGVRVSLLPAEELLVPAHALIRAEGSYSPPCSKNTAQGRKRKSRQKCPPESRVPGAQDT